MLGWEIFVKLDVDGTEKTLAFVRGSYDACNWIEDLVARGEAVDEGGNGYPSLWSSTVGAVLQVLKSQRYPYPNDLYLDLRLSDKEVSRLAYETPVVIEAWDQS